MKTYEISLSLENITMVGMVFCVEKLLLHKRIVMYCNNFAAFVFTLSM